MNRLRLRRPDRWVLRGAWLLLLLLLVLRNASMTSRIALPVGYDARAYLAAARAVRAGHDPVDPQTAMLLPELGVQTQDGRPPVPAYLYPPLLALLLIPFTALPIDTALAIWVMLVAVLMLLLIPLLSRFAGWPIAALAVLGFAQAWVTVRMGQINGIVALLMTLALLDLRRGRSEWTGGWLAAGALLKITPAISLATFLVRREWRVVLAGATLALVVIAATLPITGAGTWMRGVLFAVTQSWTARGLLSWTALLQRALGRPGLLLGFPVMALFLGLTFVRARRVPALLAMAAAFILPLLIARITWEHHAVMALPALAVLWQIGGRARLIASGTWLLITLAGGLALPVGLTLCWAACCWPEYLLGRKQAAPNR